MISVKDAIAQIRLHTNLLSPVNLPLQKALGLVLAEDIFALVSVPSFPQSAMDGYAFRYADYLRAKEFTVSGEVAAGDAATVSVAPNNAVRIFTGAAVPNDLDTVVMQEKTEILNNELIVKDEALQKGSNVRTEGSEIKKDEIALWKGTVLSPAAIGFLAGVGVAEVSVHPKPSAHIIVTGNELQERGKPLQHGQVYESNSVMLQTALQQLGINSVAVTHVTDDVNILQEALNAALKKAELVLLTGGVSVGKYDFVLQAAKACGVKQLFHKVAQRPGKPLYAGTKGKKIVFGLPGNPASVLSCFYNYVTVTIEEFTGRKNLLERKQVRLQQDFKKKISLTQFLKAVYTADGALPLQAQESFRLSSFSIANCLVVLPEEAREYKEDETVEILCLPYL
ncbi:molybdopterin molybdotransferase MoeA [Flavisolibacter ginsenosidimutans]|uniref:Molybdopterin molybdenumtransferase n=1 Tax=Flavisolibacter ginsenosidimutans TaxID=661481 RepID=A0A5B8UNI2_9BACT|nr:gephyrin-like molybdotransferase Glp [Flavisolibacter ginsenosidimutans]QEC58123.1 molybdopterin molybdotransferase MoeA [Flavisolibacter ginsenosidimutans]